MGTLVVVGVIVVFAVVVVATVVVFIDVVVVVDSIKCHLDFTRGSSVPAEHSSSGQPSCQYVFSSSRRSKHRLF